MTVSKGILLTILFASASTQASYSNERTLTYCGTLFSVDALTDAVTTIQFRGEANLAGTYKFLEDGSPVFGTLVPKSPIKDHQAILLWNDKYGSGSLAVTFSENFESFEGKWGAGNEVPGNLWQGKKCDSSSEPGISS